MEKKEKSISDEINDLKVPKENSSASSELLQFFIGVILLVVGLFMLSKRVIVHSNWYMWRIGGFDVSSGLITVPLIIGIIWYFYNSKSIVPKVLIVIGIIIIIVTIIMSVRINFVTTSLYDYILIFGMAAVGTGLLLKTLFKKRD